MQEPDNQSRVRGEPSGSSHGQSSSVGAAMRWATQVTSIAIELAVPAGGGLWLDRKYDSLPWFTILGALMGGYLAFRGLQQLIKDLEK